MSVLRLAGAIIAAALCFVAAGNVRADAPPVTQLTADGTVRDWSPDGKHLLLDARDADGYFQVYTMNADGGGRRCLTCVEVQGGPEARRHKGFAHYHPSGKFFVVQVEMPKRLVGDSRKVTKASGPGSAVWNDLWLAGIDGKSWFNLTNYTTKALTGALSPYFSHDGKHLLYAQFEREGGWKRKFGYWSLHIADFSFQPYPHLSNDRVIFSNEGIYEPHGFSPDDTRILFSSDRELKNSLGLDLWEYDLRHGTARNLTHSPDQYDEHARYSPDGKYIAWGSSRCCASFRTSLGTLISETYVMRADGSGAAQVTHFNEKGYPESTPMQSGAWPTAWSPDGAHLVISQQLLGLVLKGRPATNPSWIADLTGMK